MSWQLRNALTSLIILGASSRSTEVTLPPPPDTGVQPSHASSATRLCRWYCNEGLRSLTNGVESIQLGVGGGEGSEHLEPIIILLFILNFHTCYHGQQQTVTQVKMVMILTFIRKIKKKIFSMPFSLFPPKTSGGNECVPHAGPVTGESVAKALPSRGLTQITLSCTS